MKTTDLRYIKTEKLLQEKYLELKIKSKSPVKVSELCSLALINKTTFYDHYPYMELLHKTVCKKVVNELFDNCPHKEDLFSDTTAFVSALIDIASSKTITALFADDNAYFIELIEKKIFNVYLHNENNDEWKMRVEFVIGGALRLLTNDTQNNIPMTVKLIKEILPPTN